MNFRFISFVFRCCVLSLFGLLLLVVLSGCQVQKTVHCYDGPPLPVEQLAKVMPERKPEGGFFSTPPSYIWIETVDGKNPEEFADCDVQLEEAYVLPGPHDFEVHFRGSVTTTSMGVNGGVIGGAIGGAIGYFLDEAIYAPFKKILHFDAEPGREYLICFKEKKGFLDSTDAVEYWIEDAVTGRLVVGEFPDARMLKPEQPY